MMEYTTYKALEQFKNRNSLCFCIWWIWNFFRASLHNDILEALVGDASEFYKDDFQLVEREDGSWLVDGHYLHDFLTYFELDDLINDCYHSKRIDNDWIYHIFQNKVKN
jgi:putative hemolysin